MKIKLKILIPVLILIVLVIGILIYTRPMQLSQICGDIDIAKIESFNVTYEIHPDDEVVQYSIDKADPRFLLITNLIVSQKYRRTIWNVFPSNTKTHLLQEGDYKWELGCIASDCALRNGEVVSGSVIHLSNFYGKLEISCLGSTWRCTADNQAAWISEIMDTIIVE